MRSKLILLFMTAALAMPATSSAATCPPGQTGTPPYCVTPPIVKAVKTTPKTITITIKVDVLGRVKVSGKGIRTKSVSVQPGSVKITVKLTPREKKLLNEKGKVKLKLKITHTPTGGSPVVKTTSVVVKKHTR